MAVDLYTLLHSLTLLFLTLLHHDTAGLVTLTSRSIHNSARPLTVRTVLHACSIYMEAEKFALGVRLIVWSLALGVWSLALGVWSLALGVWSLEFDVWSLQLGVWRLEFGAWSSTFGVCSLEFGAWSLELGVRTFDWCDVLVYVFHACAKTRVLYRSVNRRHVA